MSDPEYNRTTPPPEVPAPPEATAPVNAATISRPYTRRKLVLALLTLLLGFCFVWFVLFARPGLGAALFVALSIGVIIFWLAARRVRPHPALFLGLLLASSLAVSLVLYNDAVLSGVFLLIIAALCGYFVFSAFGCRAEPRLGDWVLLDLIKACFIMPFCALTSFFPALFGGDRKSGGARRFGYIILGLLCAVIPTALAVTALAHGDAAFSALCERLSGSFGEYLIKFLLAIPAAMLIFSVLLACGERRHSGIFTLESDRRGRESLRFVPSAVVYAALAPLCVVYLAYFAAQSTYFLDAFRGLVPEGFSAAEYARRGFFELCGVSCMNLGMLSLGALFCKKSAGGRTTGMCVFTVIYSVLTLLLLTTALRKMLLYIEMYGLTRLRLLTSAFMVLLALLFLLLIVRQFFARFPLARVFAGAAAVVLLLLAFPGVNDTVARTNIALWQNGQLEELDIDALTDLGDAAVPYLIALSQDNGIDEATRAAAANALALRRKQTAARLPAAWYEYNLTSSRADALLWNT